MQDKDEYINSLLLSLFLMQGEINRLNETLDLARKRELVYINNPQIAALKAYKDVNEDFKKAWEELKAENKKLEEATHSLLNIQYALAYSCKKYSETLQEIKEIAERTGCRAIIDLITKAESEEE